MTLGVTLAQHPATRIGSLCKRSSLAVLFYHPRGLPSPHIRTNGFPAATMPLYMLLASALALPIFQRQLQSSDIDINTALLDALKDQVGVFNAAIDAAIPSVISVDAEGSGKDKFTIIPDVCSGDVKYDVELEDVKNANTATISSFDSVDSQIDMATMVGTVTITASGSVKDVTVSGKASSSVNCCGVSASVSGTAETTVKASGTLTITACLLYTSPSPRDS